MVQAALFAQAAFRGAREYTERGSMAGVVGESCWARLAIVLESPFSDSEHVQDCVSSCLKALQHIAGAGAALTPELRSRLRIGLHEYIALEGTEALELDAAKLRSAPRQ